MHFDTPSSYILIYNPTNTSINLISVIGLRISRNNRVFKNYSQIFLVFYILPDTKLTIA